ncbi:testis-expressed protein 50-like [Carettochelys insculpta]|uniref:testis-expressed protein 50-like n=1 Tax=Carettochelys insculpta TaxID=44489 RepID=UPI003EBE64C9
MFVQGLSLIVPLWIIFFCFQESVGLCNRPAWARVGWEILPEDLEQLQLGTQLPSSCLPYPLDLLSHYFPNLETAEGGWEVQSVSCKVTLVLLGGLCMYGLWCKLRRPQEKISVQTSSTSITTEFHAECTCNVDKTLCQLLANMCVMMKYLKYLCHRHRKEIRHWKLSRKRKGEETKDEKIFPICPYSHSSMDTEMEEI